MTAIIAETTTDEGRVDAGYLDNRIEPDYSVGGFVASDKRESKAYAMGDGSEAEVRSDEEVCPGCNLTHYAATPCATCDPDAAALMYRRLILHESV